MMEALNIAEIGTPENAAAARQKLKTFGVPLSWPPEMISMIRVRLEDKSRDSRYEQVNKLFPN